MKRISCMVLAIVMVVFGFSGCGGGSTATGLDPKNPTTVTMWHYYVGDNQQALEQAVQDFNQSVGLEKGVIVEAIGQGSIADLEEKIEASAKGVVNSDPMPDIFSSYPDVAYKIDMLDKLADLGEYFTQEEQAKYVQGFLSDGIFSGGRLLLLPIVKSTELLYVNDTAWSEFCAAEGYNSSDLATWESLYDTARAFYQATDADTPDTLWDGKALTGFDSVANYIIVGNRQMGVEIIQAGEDSGSVVLDQGAMKRIFDVYYKGMVLGYFGEFGKFRSDDLKQNDLISYVGSSSGAAYFPTEVAEGNSLVPIDFLPLPYPTFAGGEDTTIQQGAGMCVAKSDDAHQQGAAEFLKWFTQPEQNIAFAMTTGYLPVTEEAYQSTAFTDVLESLAGGDEAEQIVSAVYSVALTQITEQNAYSAKPFEFSYDVRSALQYTLMDMAAEGLEAAAPLKDQGLSEEEILEELDVDGRFGDWIDLIKGRLDGLEITYIEQ